MEINNKNNVIYVFIDASNLWQAQKTKGKFFDFGKLKKFIEQKFNSSLVEVFYYSAYPAEGTRNYCLDGKHKFFTLLEKGLGFKVWKKELKRIPIINEEGMCFKEKGNMDVEITIDVMFHIDKFNIAIFFTGDSDFLALVSHLRNSGKKVYIFSSKNNISEELKTGGDGYFEVLDIEENIWRDELRHRARK